MSKAPDTRGLQARVKRLENLLDEAGTHIDNAMDVLGRAALNAEQGVHVDYGGEIDALSNFLERMRS